MGLAAGRRTVTLRTSSTLEQVCNRNAECRENGGNGGGTDGGGGVGGGDGGGGDGGTSGGDK
eukprot:1295064-Prymnesium_polylepis.1